MVQHKRNVKMDDSRAEQFRISVSKPHSPYQFTICSKTSFQLQKDRFRMEKDQFINSSRVKERNLFCSQKTQLCLKFNMLKIHKNPKKYGRPSTATVASTARHDLALAQILQERPEVVPSVHRLDKKCLRAANSACFVGSYTIRKTNK